VTVAELIAQLQKFPDGARVVTPHFHSGYSEIDVVGEMRVMAGIDSVARGELRDPDAIKGEEDFFYPTETDVVLDWTGSLQSEPGET